MDCLERTRILISEIFLIEHHVIQPILTIHLLAVIVVIIIPIKDQKKREEEQEDNVGIGTKDDVIEEIAAGLLT